MRRCGSGDKDGLLGTTGSGALEGTLLPEFLETRRHGSSSHGPGPLSLRVVLGPNSGPYHHLSIKRVLGQVARHRTLTQAVTQQPVSQHRYRVGVPGHRTKHLQLVTHRPLAQRHGVASGGCTQEWLG